jgi:hypothetical protein
MTIEEHVPGQKSNCRLLLYNNKPCVSKAYQVSLLTFLADCITIRIVGDGFFDVAPSLLSWSRQLLQGRREKERLSYFNA